METVDNKLIVHTINGIESYLNDKAKELAGKIISSTVYYDKDTDIVYPCVYATITVPLDDDGTYYESYSRRWGNFLNALADSGVWQFGSLSPYGFIELYTGPVFALNQPEPTEQEKAKIYPRKGVFFSYIFIKNPYDNFKALIDKLNADFNVKVFVQEGEIGGNSWDSFPY